MIWQYEEKNQPFKCSMILHVLGKLATIHFKWLYGDNTIVGFSFPYISNANITCYNEALAFGKTISLDHVNMCEVEVALKGEHSSQWLNVQGTVRKGNPGASKDNEAYFVLLAKGLLCYGWQDKLFTELFISLDSSEYKRYILRKLFNKWDVGVIARQLANVAIEEDFEPCIIEQSPESIKKRDVEWYILCLPEEQTPYILQTANERHYTKKGYSFLPDVYKHAMPHYLAFWNENDPRFAQMRLQIMAEEIKRAHGDYASVGDSLE